MSRGEGWHRVPVLGGSSTDWGQSLWPARATLDVGGPSSGCKMEAQDLFKHLLSTHLGSAWAGG